nr:glycosyltransferase [Lolliginicoccus lacisalsi]
MTPPTATRPTVLWASHSGKTTGGSERSLVASARILVERGHRVIVTMPADLGLRDPLLSIGVEALVVPHIWWVRQAPATHAEALGSALAIARFREIIRVNQVDVVISNTITCPWAAVAASLSRVPHIWYIREFGAEDHGFNFYLGPARTYRAIDALSSSIVANSAAVAEHIGARIGSPRPVAVSHPVVDLPATLAAPAGQAIARTRVRLVMVGMVTPSKGQLDAAKALCLVLRQGQHDLELVLVGATDRAYKARIIECLRENGIARDRVVFAGYQPDPIPWIRGASIFIMASRCEAFGRVTVEAMACGIPVIGSRSGGTPDLVNDGENGLLYEPGDADALARHIASLAASPGLIDRMGQAGRRRYAELLAPESCISPMLEAIDTSSLPRPYSAPRAFGLVLALVTTIHLTLVTKKAIALGRRLERASGPARRMATPARSSAIARAPRDPAALLEWSLERRGKSVLDASRRIAVIIPVFGDWDSLQHNIASVRADLAANPACDVYYVNDCGPRADDLEHRILAAIEGLDNVHYSCNPRNLGFVGNCNNAVLNLVDQASDVLLLNSDTIVTHGFAEEMQRVLYAEGQRFGAVTSRSNAATIFSVPMGGQLPMEQAYAHYLGIVDGLPQWYEAPVAHGFCMMIRREVINDLGLFDTAYGKGYGEENDFCMRIRRKGWQCAVANRSFVLHYRARSFTPRTRAAQVAANEKILDSRYPEYRQLVRQYKESITEPAPR